MRNSGLVSVFLLFCIVFLALFGPKLAGFVDTAAIGAALSLAVLPFLTRIRIPDEFLVLLAIVCAICVYAILVFVFNNGDDGLIVFRYVRAFLSTAFLGLVFYNLGLDRFCSARTLLNVVLAVLLINAVFVLLQIAMPSVKAAMAAIYGFNKSFVLLRSFGLTAGYDTAGYLCVLGSLVAALCALSWRSFSYVPMMVVFSAASVFTSRSSMALSFLALAVVVVLFITRGRLGLKVVGLFMAGSGASIAIIYVLPLLAATFSVLSGLGGGNDSSLDFTASFSATDLGQWRDAMWRLPDNQYSILFGDATYAYHSDIGYIKTIHMIGIVGLMASVLAYAYIGLCGLVVARLAIHPEVEAGQAIRIIAVVVAATATLVLVVNIKNLYFFTRGYHELLVILFFFLLGTRDRLIVALAVPSNERYAIPNSL